tara:strand:+ start:349 stop:1110 length:762 start_codon:yes stop_codon:yes gene_type:complete
MDLKSKIKKTIINLFARIKKSDDSRCIFYHDIHSDNKFTHMSTSVDLFIKHINIIQDLGFEIVHEITKEKKQIAISFDDGFKGVYENIEVINRLKIPVTIFVVSSFLGRDNFLNNNNLQEIAKNEFIDIQSHSHSHVELSNLDSNTLHEELQKSKEILESICKNKINSICFPKGMFNRLVIKKALELGYEKQFSSLPGSYYANIFAPSSQDNCFLSVRRRSLVQFSEENEFRSILNGGDTILYNWYYKKHFVR